MDKTPRLKFFTAVNPDLWQAYAEKTTATWRGLDLEIHWQRDQGPWHQWRQTNLETRPEPDFAHTWQRFSHKVEAQVENLLGYRDQGYDSAVWLDADVVVCKPLETLPGEVYPGDGELLTYLGRGRQYPETGWIAYNLRHRELDCFVSHLRTEYLEDRIFEHSQWHDAYVWDQVSKSAGIPRRSIGPEQPGEAFGRSPLRDHLIHAKGPRKQNVDKADLTRPDRTLLMRKPPK